MELTAADTFERMDSMYRFQRYFYDATRKYYLLGRDRLLNEMQIAPRDTVAEIGCGTARNLEVLARRHPQAGFFGLDASAAMLKTAHAKIDAAGLNNVTLAEALADTFTYRSTFGLDEPLDRIFFSYSISMIPTWRESMANALENLKDGGTLSIVDFYDQADLPSWFGAALRWWLRQFGVEYRDSLIDHLDEMERSGLGTLDLRGIARRYSFIAHFQKPPKS